MMSEYLYQLLSALYVEVGSLLNLKLYLDSQPASPQEPPVSNYPGFPYPLILLCPSHTITGLQVCATMLGLCRGAWD